MLKLKITVVKSINMRTLYFINDLLKIVNNISIDKFYDLLWLFHYTELENVHTYLRRHNTRISIVCRLTGREIGYIYNKEN